MTPLAESLITVIKKKMVGITTKQIKDEDRTPAQKEGDAKRKK